MADRHENAQHNDIPALLRPVYFIFGPPTKRNVLTWIGLILAVLILRWAFIEPFKIPSASMEPTLHGDPGIGRGDRVAVNKMAYGLRYPFNGAKIPFTDTRLWYANSRLVKGPDPERFDIVVFRAVGENPRNSILIKRVIGLPGERVHIADGKVHINGEALVLPEDMPEVYYTDRLELSQEQIDQYMEAKNIPHDRRAFIEKQLRADMRKNNPYEYGIRTEDEYAVVPEGHYLVLGDNSAHSGDGRVFGWVPNHHILGRSFCIWFPLNRLRDFSGFSATWWGRGLLFGIPALIVLIEVVHAIRKKRRAKEA